MSRLLAGIFQLLFVSKYIQHKRQYKYSSMILSDISTKLMQFFSLRQLGGFGLKTTKTSNGGSHGDGTGSAQCVASSRDDFTATSAFPDSRALALDRVLAAKDTSVRGVLRDLDLLHQLSQGGTVAGSVLSGDAYFLGAFTHFVALVGLASE
jgi:hypothetical protein